MDFIPTKIERRPIPPLPITALVDAFTIIVIFLILGTVFATSDITVPGNLRLPKSISTEALESAPQALITEREVVLSLSKKKYPLGIFVGENPPALERALREVRAEVTRLAKNPRSSGLILNITADQRTPYRTLFDVTKVFRQAGFETLLFVAEGSQ